MIKMIKKISDIFKLIETGMLVFFVSAMVIVSFSQIILRNFFRAVDWFDALLRYLVLWAGMIAAGIAAYEKKHIKIDIIGKFARGRLKNVVYIVIYLFAGVICLILSVISAIYIFTIEMSSNEQPPFLGIRKWILLTIIPIGFLTMSVRFFVRSGVSIYKFIKNINEESDEMDDYEDIYIPKDGEECL